MATYNGEKFIQQQLESFFNQRRLPDLIVACDDCSQDRTVEILEEAQKNKTVKVDLHKNPSTLGFMNNFLKAAALCRTNLIAFSDQDDVWHQDKLNKCIPYFNDPTVQLVIHGSHVTNADGKVEGCQSPSRRLQVINKLSKDPWFVPLGHTMVFRSSLMSIVSLQDVPPEMICHERWIYLLASVFGRIVLLPEPLVYYRRHNGNVTTSLADHSLATRMTRKVAADSMDAQTGLFKTYSSLLGGLKATSDSNGGELRTGSEFYSRVARHLEQRRDLYGSVSRREKASVLLGLLSQKGYRSRDKGGLGIGSLARDVVSVWR